MDWCFIHHFRAQYDVTNPFISSFEGIELYFLSFGVPTKPGITKDLTEAGDIGMKAVSDFIDSFLAENLSFITP